MLTKGFVNMIRKNAHSQFFILKLKLKIFIGKYTNATKSQDSTICVLLSKSFLIQVAYGILNSR